LPGGPNYPVETYPAANASCANGQPEALGIFCSFGRIG
jgi:hypothetical protein